MRLFLMLLIALVQPAAAAAQAPERAGTQLQIDPRVREGTVWFAENQAIMWELISGPMDATEAIAIVGQYDAELITDGQMRAAGEELGQRRRAQLADIRARYEAIETPSSFYTIEFQEHAEQFTETLGEMFRQAEVLIQLEADLFNRLNDKYGDLSDIVIADFESRRLTLRGMIGLNESAILSIPGGHPQEFLLRGMNGTLAATLALLDIQESFQMSGTLDEIGPSLEDMSNQATRMRRFASAGRNSIEPTTQRIIAALPPDARNNSQAQISALFETYPASFDELDVVAALIDDFVEALPQVQTEEEFWSEIDGFIDASSLSDDRSMALQQERARFIAGQ